MIKIYYFNINYYCNNDCIFCFSSSTGNNSHQISIEDFRHRIASVKPSKEDKVVFNGGEPSIHPAFYSMLNYVNENYSTNVVVYTNGVSLDLSKINIKENLMFILPIHGEKELHDYITRNKGSFSSTINNIKSIQKKGIKYAIKFIINSNMIENKFKQDYFLKKYNLSPNEIVIARMNETKKSKANRVEIVDNRAFIGYLNLYTCRLQETYVLKYLDIPFCYLKDVGIENLDIMDVPEFYFNDYKYKMLQKKYYKDIYIGDSCKKCEYFKLCNLLSSTYLTISFRDKWRLEIE